LHVYIIDIAAFHHSQWPHYLRLLALTILDITCDADLYIVRRAGYGIRHAQHNRVSYVLKSIPTFQYNRFALDILDVIVNELEKQERRR